MTYRGRAPARSGPQPTAGVFQHVHSARHPRMADLTTYSAKKLANLIQGKQVSCLEVMRAYLDRIAAVNPRLNAVVQLLPAEAAFDQARAADAALSREPASCGKLHGVPVTIKD